jgi:hypothetical protein
MNSFVSDLHHICCTWLCENHSYSIACAAGKMSGN